MDGTDVGPSRTKWWGPDRHIVIYYTHRGTQRDLLRHQRAGAGGMADARVVVGQGRRARAARGVRRISSRCARRARGVPRLPQVGDPRARAAAALERRAGRAAGRRVPSDDAVHGAGRARRRWRTRRCSRAASRRRRRRIEGAFTRYEAHRKPRTSRIQAISSANTWMKAATSDTVWLYGYDAWEVDLGDPAPAAAA